MKLVGGMLAILMLMVGDADQPGMLWMVLSNVKFHSLLLLKKVSV